MLALANIPLFAIDFDRLGIIWLAPVFVVLLSLGAVLLGRRGLRANTSGEASHRLPAVFGVILGWVGVGFAALAVVVLVVLLVVMVGAGA